MIYTTFVKVYGCKLPLGIKLHKSFKAMPSMKIKHSVLGFDATSLSTLLQYRRHILCFIFHIAQALTYKTFTYLS